MGYWRGLTILGTFAALACGVAAAQQATAYNDRNDAYFARALAHMNALPTPPSFTYTADIRTNGGSLAMYPAADAVSTTFVVGDKGTADNTLTFSFDQPKHQVYLVGGASALGPTPTPIFDPTWNSAFRWMQNRRLFDVDVDVAQATPAPQPAATPLKTITIVSRSPSLSYHVVGAERATCANGDTGWQLHVVPVADPQDHPLVGVLVDESTGLLCAAQFEESIRSVPDAHARGAVELRFARVGDYYVMTDESLMLHLNPQLSASGMSATITLEQVHIR